MLGTLTLEKPSRSGDIIEVAAILSLNGERHRLWCRLPVEWESSLTPWADSFVIQFLFPLMEAKADMVVEGCVSPSLLANLERYMACFHAWFPQLYRPVGITAREEVELPAVPAPRALMTFSCGADSCFTVLRHARKLIGRRVLPLAAGVLVHGFDVKLDYAAGEVQFAGLLASARAMLGSLGLACIPMMTNFRELPFTWGRSHMTQLVGGLRLLAGGFDTALIPNSVPYAKMGLIWGSHPALDPLLSSRNYAVVDDGAEASRVEKLELMHDWPEGLQHLRVCFGIERGDHTNCCVCEKCIRTILAARIAGIEKPAAFARDVTDAQIKGVRFHEAIACDYWRAMLRSAAARGLADKGWVRLMAAAVRRHDCRQRLNALKKPFVPLRNKLRQVFRGSAKSKKQLAAQRSKKS